MFGDRYPYYLYYHLTYRCGEAVAIQNLFTGMTPMTDPEFTCKKLYLLHNFSMLTIVYGLPEGQHINGYESKPWRTRYPTTDG